MRRLIPLTESLAHITAGQAVLATLQSSRPDARLVIGRSPLSASITSVRSLTFEEARALLCLSICATSSNQTTTGDLTDVIR